MKWIIGIIIILSILLISWAYQIGYKEGRADGRLDGICESWRKQCENLVKSANTQNPKK